MVLLWWRSLRWRDLSGTLTTLRFPPSFCEFMAIIRRPLEHHALYLRRKVALVDLQCFNVYRGFMAPAFDVEVRLAVVSPVNPDHDSMEAADLRQRRLVSI